MCKLKETSFPERERFSSSVLAATGAAITFLSGKSSPALGKTNLDSQEIYHEITLSDFFPFFLLLRVCNIYIMRKMWENVGFFIAHVFYKVCGAFGEKEKFVCHRNAV
jgi:hypothetical protein